MDRETATIEREAPGPSPVAGDRLRLFLASFLMLFVELVLIRWLGAHIVYLSYFSNFVLLGAFLGIGIGFLRSDGPDWFRWAPVLLTALVALSRIFPVNIDRSGSTLIFFGSTVARGLPMWVVLPVMFVAVAVTMTAIAQGVARLFGRFPPLDAYRLDVLGSVAGIGTFSVLSLLGAPPLAWGIVIGVVFVLLLRPSVTMLHVVALAGLLVIFGRDVFTPGVVWSPYYRVMWGQTSPGVTSVWVNGIPHQVMAPLGLRRRLEPTYFVAYERAPGNPLDRVLIIGAGTGSDVAIALSEGAKHVDAVEIDPELAALGKSLNPQHPYDDPRVRLFVNDGRAFLERSHETYDLILFALPDSLTLVAGQSSLRLESYLFTREAMDAAKRHLSPGGVFAMYNYYREAWLADRLANTLQEVYGRAPCFDSERKLGYLALLTTSVDPSAVDCPHPWVPAVRPVVAPATDDRPFVYLRGRTIPSFYLLTLALILLASAAGVRVIGGPFAGMGKYVDLFFMGVAFLLLETKNVVQFALLFGTTWLVNALVFAGILLTVLLAIEVARRIPRPNPKLLYGLLAASIAIAWVVPESSLLRLAVVPRFFAACALAFAPVFCANLVFAERFVNVASPTVAFGTNLLGAMVGGTLEYSSLVVGYRALLIVAACIYALAFLAGRRWFSLSESS